MTWPHKFLNVAKQVLQNAPDFGSGSSGLSPDPTIVCSFLARIQQSWFGFARHSLGTLERCGVSLMDSVSLSIVVGHI